MGSVSPLLAIAEEIENRCQKDSWQKKPEFIWLGTKKGVERSVIEKIGWTYIPIYSGKWRRYFSLANLSDLLKVVFGFFQAIYFFIKYRPDLVLSAGSFVALPVVAAAKITGVKTVLHQLDLKPGLTNRLAAPFATAITVAFPETKKFFNEKKSLLLATPVRKIFYSGTKEQAKKDFGFDSNEPMILVMGGSLGAEKINDLIFENLPELLEFCQIAHVLGKGQKAVWENKQAFGVKAEKYKNFEYLEENLAAAYAAADLLVCRAGLATISEIMALNLVSIILPIPNNQQEENAKYLEQKGAAVVFDQQKGKDEEFVEIIKKIIFNENIRIKIKSNLAKLAVPEPTAKYVDWLLSWVKINSKQ